MNKCSYVHKLGGKMNNENDKILCEEECFHRDLIEEVTSKMPCDDSLYDLAELFKVFGDTTRIRILHALSVRELCVCDISMVLGVSQSAVSHQLRVLKNSKLVKFRREGKSVFYSLDDCHIEGILKQGLEHICE